MIRNVSYEVSMTIPKGDRYFGNLITTFHVKSIENDTGTLFIEYKGEKIDNLKINEHVILPVNESIVMSEDRSTILRVNLKSQYLKLGHNRVEMDFVNKYRHDSKGFHSFQD